MGNGQIFDKALAKHNAGKYEEAIKLYKIVLMKSPMHLDANYMLGTIYAETGKFDEAVKYLRKAEKIMPSSPFIKVNLGNVYMEQGEYETALLSFASALEIKYDIPEAHYNLGKTLNYLGRLDEAEASYRTALEIKPDFSEVYNNLALLLNKQGKSLNALNAIMQSIQIKETPEAKSIFVTCIKNILFAHDDSEIRLILIRALTEPWGRPGELEKVITNLIKLNPGLRCLLQEGAVWPQRLLTNDLFGSGKFATVAADPLFCALLCSTPICDIEMERFLAMARLTLLEAATGLPDSFSEAGGTALKFYTALTSQCFINEYLFSYLDDEIRKANELRDSMIAALDANTQVPTLWILAVAAYFPLYSLPRADRLANDQWPPEVTSVLTQQIREPLEELQLRPSISRLTAIQNEISLQVQAQYEENPYPRWVKAAPVWKKMNVNEYMQHKFPHTPFKRYKRSGCLDVLIAGCGTGQHSIHTAQQFSDAQVLAVDLSISSLCYAQRKTKEVGLASIEYAQADLLKLGSLNRNFDVIESVGVLHHLADPWGGWRAILPLLRSGGFMRLGFYSEVARRNIVRIRDFIAEQGYGSDAAEIRRCRQDLIAMDNGDYFGNTLKLPDFFSTSNCRDLLFHVQEHHLTLSKIDRFLAENNLLFIGFEIDHVILQAYKMRFPDDISATNLGCWQVFENENPDAFTGMYQFWIQNAE